MAPPRPVSAPFLLALLACALLAAAALSPTALAQSAPSSPSSPSSAAAAAPPRDPRRVLGVPPSLAAPGAAYDPARDSFGCLDGSGAIPFGRV